MHFLSQPRTHLVAGLAVLAVAVGAGATAAPASAGTAFCNSAPTPMYRTAYVQCQIAEYNIWLRARALCKSGSVASSEWKVFGKHTNWFIGHNRRPNWNSSGFERLYCRSGVQQVSVDGSFKHYTRGRIFPIPVVQGATGASFRARA